MIKRIPGNLNYRINLKGQIFDHYGTVVQLPVQDGKVTLELYGKKRTVKLSWLALFAWYECGDILNVSDNLEFIEFKEANNRYLRIRCGKIMTLANPIYYKEGFRYIPNHPRYAINQDGVVLDTLTNEVVPGDKTDNRG